MSNQQKIIHKFIKSDDFKRFHVHGFWGGVNQYNEIDMYLYEDSIQTPALVETIVDVDSLTFEQKFNVDNQLIDRIGHAQITIPISIVPGVIEWLQEKLKDAQNKVEFKQDNGNY